MSTKENIEYIKQELSSDEKLLESLLKTERFMKRYKKPLLASVVAVVLLVLGYMGYAWKKERDIIEANRLYTHLLQSPNDTAALAELKSKAPGLWALVRYSQAVRAKDAKSLQALSKLEDPIISDLASYHLAALARDERKLHDYTLSGHILKDIAHLERAYLLYQKGKIAAAKRTLALIEDRRVKDLYGKLLDHYGTKVKK